MKILIPILLFISLTTNNALGIPNDSNEEHEGWMEKNIDNNITILVNKKAYSDYIEKLNRSYVDQDNENNSPQEKILQQIIDLVAQKKDAMCKANPDGEWELHLSVGVDDNIKIVEIKSQTTVIVKVKC